MNQTLILKRDSIDYDAFIQQLIAHVEAFSEVDASHAAKIVTPTAYLRDYRTVGITAPKAAGRRQWIIKQLKERDDTCVIVLNDLRKNELRMDVPFEKNSCIYTARDVMAMYAKVAGGGLPDWPVYNRVIVKNAFVVFSEVPQSIFYKWAAQTERFTDRIIIAIG